MDRSPDRLWREAQRQMTSGDAIAARRTLQTLLQQEPGHAAAHMTLAHIAWARGWVRESAHHALQVSENPPADAGAIIAVSMALLRVGETVAARACLRHPAMTVCTEPQLLMYHAGLRRQLGDDVEALALLDRAHALGFEGSEFRFVRGMESLICGHLAEAETDFEASLRMDPSAGAAALELARLRKQTAERNHLADFSERVRRVQQGTQDHAALEFARYKELEDLGRYKEAWHSLRQANDLMRALHPCDPQQARRQTDELVRICTPEFLVSGRGTDTGPQPIFILGLPRSGSTLLDRMLGSHSQVSSAGELEDFAWQLCWSADWPGLLDTTMLERLPDLDYEEIGKRYLSRTQWRARGARFFIDKQPWNHAVTGLILRALPQARVLHITRDPMDVCFSNFRAMLGARYAYSFDLQALARHYRHYRRLHAHWQKIAANRMLDVSYEDLVLRTEPTLRKVLSFCQLEWEPVCLNGSLNDTAVGTLSAAQARKPIYRGAHEARWPYKRELAELAEAIATPSIEKVGSP